MVNAGIAIIFAASITMNQKELKFHRQEKRSRAFITILHNMSASGEIDAGTLTIMFGEKGPKFNKWKKKLPAFEPSTNS